MNYQIKAESNANDSASITVKSSKIDFGIRPDTSEKLPNPAELFLGAFAACMLKNVERFSKLMNFSYEKTMLNVSSVRLENPPRMAIINYQLTIFSNDKKLNVNLLKKNIEKFGTIYNTVKLASDIEGAIEFETVS